MNITILKFSSNTCVPCKQYEPIFTSVVGDLDIPAEHVRLENSPDMFSRYNVNKVPTTVLIDSDTRDVLDAFVWPTDYDNLKTFILKHM